MATQTTDPWPALPWDAWGDTCQTLHMWTQVVGKVKLELTPFLNHFWEVGFHLTGRGMTTGLIPYADRAFDVTFDFLDHNLAIQASNGATRTLPLSPRSVADFYQEFMAALQAIGIEVAVNTTPSEVLNPIPFEHDRAHASYDPAYVERWWRVQVQTAKVLQRYRSPFVGKSSPILFYWGSFDLNVARYSGRPAEPPPGPVFFRLAENQENVACGFWPGNPTFRETAFREPAFYAYTYPEPAGFKEAAVRPGPAYFNAELGEFVLHYEDARRADAPDEAILDFFQSVYEAAATLARWDRAALEQPPE
jgi:hypothetical protein